MKKSAISTAISGVLLSSIGGQAFASTQKDGPSISTEILKLLPSQAQLIPSDSKGHLVRSFSLNNDGNTEYAVTYKYSTGDAHNRIGAIIVKETGGKVKKLWQYNGKIALVNSGSISLKDLLANGKKEVIFQGSEGAMANFVEVLAWKNNGVSSILQTQAYHTDIGQYEDSKQDQIATWSLDTGDLFNIQMYGWNSKTGTYMAIPNSDTPNYFKHVVVPYYRKLGQSPVGRQTPKMVDYGLAQAYLYGGEFQQAKNEITDGLNIKSAYPSNSQFQMLESQVPAKEKRSK